MKVKKICRICKIERFQTPVVNGISFHAKGIFTQIGVQSILLSGGGTPQLGGTFEIPINLNNSNCSFSLNVEYKRIDTSMYYYFEAGNQKFSGCLDSAQNGFLTTAVGKVNTLSFGSVLTMSTDTNEDFAGGMDFSTKQNLIYYTSNNLSSFKINLINYAYNNRLISDEFNGPVIDSSGKTLNITKGIFKTYLSH